MTSVTEVQSASACLFAGTWRPLVSIITTLYYVAIIFHRRVIVIVLPTNPRTLSKIRNEQLVTHYGLQGKGLVWLVGVVLCQHAAQLHNALFLAYINQMPLRERKMSLGAIHGSSTTTTILTYTLITAESVFLKHVIKKTYIKGQRPTTSRNVLSFETNHTIYKYVNKDELLYHLSVTYSLKEMEKYEDYCHKLLSK